jgi:hypothetical protein
MKEQGLAEITVVTDGGPWATHNYPCPVYREKHAVIDLSTGIFQPSWEAQYQGWRLIKADSWVKFMVLRLFWRDA